MRSISRHSSSHSPGRYAAALTPGQLVGQFLLRDLQIRQEALERIPLRSDRSLEVDDRDGSLVDTS